MNSAKHIDRMHKRAAIVDAMRKFFATEKFLEVDTPIAIKAPAPEMHIEAPAVIVHTEDRFSVDTSNHGQEPSQTQRRFLQTSPELSMKRLLAEGYERIYQIAPVFRDGDYGDMHRPEFRLLEWYRRDASWQQLFDDCENIVLAAAKASGHGQTIRYRGNELSLSTPFKRIKMDEAFVRYAGFSILDHLEVPSLRGQLKHINISFEDSDDWNDLFHRVFLSLVEPELLRDGQPIFLTHYPAPLAALAQRCPEDERVSQRTELYIGGVEIANGFGELTDAQEQRQRFEQARLWRSNAGAADYPLDEEFLSSLAHLPPSCGMALGLERLLMVLLGAKTMEQVMCVGWDHV